MFTGIIETVGTLRETKRSGSNLMLCFESEISSELKIDQSVNHNGVCLTVTKVSGKQHWVTAVDETLNRSNLGGLSIRDEVNLERCMKADGRFDGHIVQGHVDETVEVLSKEELEGSWLFRFRVRSGTTLIVEKGSICINGVSLTCFDVSQDQFSVTIIPYTYEHTTFRLIESGDLVNLEFDVVGKYIQKLLASGS